MDTDCPSGFTVLRFYLFTNRNKKQETSDSSKVKENDRANPNTVTKNGEREWYEGIRL